MAKYLDERITVEFDGLTAEKVYNYFVYYNPDDAEKETIFAGNLYAESTTKTLDITDIVQNDITKRGYGKEFQYSVEIVNKVKEVSVYHIYRYPHKLAKYLYKIDTYYTDCKASDKEPILLPTYPETYTDNLQKEQYFSYSKKINPLRITASKITGNIGDSATFPALLTHSTEDYITSTFIDGGISFNVQTPFAPKSLYYYKYPNGYSSEEYYEESISSFPYETSDSISGKLLNVDYPFDLYITADESEINFYPYFCYYNYNSPFYGAFDLSIVHYENSLADDSIWNSSDFNYYDNRMECDTSSDSQTANTDTYTIDLVDRNNAICWTSDSLPLTDGVLNISLWENTDDYDIKYSELKGFNINFYDSNGDLLITKYQALATEECAAKSIKLAFETYSTASTIGVTYYISCTITDEYYDIILNTTATNTLQSPQSIYFNSMGINKAYYITQTEGYQQELCSEYAGILSGWSDNIDKLYYYFGEIGKTQYISDISITIYDRYGVLYSKVHKNIALGKTISISLFSERFKYVNDLHIQFAAKLGNGNNSYLKVLIPGGMTLSKNLYIENNGTHSVYLCTVIVDGDLSRVVTVDDESSRIRTIDRINLNSPFFAITCPKGYFLQWRDRWGSLQCQPFNKVNEYSEDIEASEITNYYGNRSIYKTENQPTFKINSGWIDTDVYPVYESIFVSPTLKLYDADTDTSYDVILKDRSYTEKTFENQQHQMFNLTLSLELSTKQTILY